MRRKTAVGIINQECIRDFFLGSSSSQYIRVLCHFILIIATSLLSIIPLRHHIIIGNI